MRRVLITLICIAALSPAAFAQDDHRDASPPLIGYAVVTPTAGFDPDFGIPGGLVVFETFGYRSEVPALQAAVGPATMTTRLALFASAAVQLSRNVGVAITNPGTQDAVVTLTMRRTDGAIVASRTVAVASHHQVAQFISELFADVPEMPVVFDGTITVTSDTPVAVLGLRFRGAKFSSIPITSLSPEIPLPVILSGIGGPDAVLLPQFAAEGRWAPEMIILNNGTGPLTVRIDLFKQDGTPLVTTLNHSSGSSFQDLMIPGGGVIMFSPRDASGDSDF